MKSKEILMEVLRGFDVQINLVSCLKGWKANRTT